MTDAKQQTPDPMDALKDAVGGLGKALLEFGVSRAGGAVGGLTERLTNFSDNPVGSALGKSVEAVQEGDSPVKAAFKGAGTLVKDTLTGGGRKKEGDQGKYTNIVEWIDVGVPVRDAYNQWTQFQQWPQFMKKLEYAKPHDNEPKIDFKGQVFWSHRTWTSTVIEMVPDSHIVWRSTGQKGYLNGGVSFSEYGPRLTRICIVVEYHPQGFFEKTGNIWRAVGRRVRVEAKRYVHQVMTNTIVDPDSVEGWRAEVRDSEIVRTHDEVVEQEQQEEEERRQAEEQEAAGEDEDRDEDYDDEDYDEDQDYDEDRGDYGDEEEEPEEGEEPEDGDYEDADEEYDEAEEEPEPEPEPQPARRPSRQRR
jgi:hypothetical protein